MRRNRIHITVIVLLLIAAMFTGVFVAQHMYHHKVDSSKFHGTYLENPRPINPFVLTGIDGQPFTNDNLKGQWTLIFFGFTNCPSLCPTTMADLNKVYQILQENHVKQLPRVVMISIDPERDSLQKLKSYVTSFHPAFFGARGDEETIKAMTREMGITYTKVMNQKNGDAHNYEIDHSGAIMLFNPEGELNAFFTTPHHPEFLASDYMLLM